MRVRSFLASTVVLSALVVAASGVASAQTEVITFDDYSATTSVAQIFNGYKGLNWTNFYVIHENYHVGSGYDKGTVSGNYTAFNGFASDAFIIEAQANETFSLDSFYLTAAWDTTLNVKIDGFTNGVITHTQTVTVNNQVPTFFTFNWGGIDQLKFDSVNGDQFAMDNLQVTRGNAPVVPEGDAVALLAMGGLPIVGMVLRNRRKSAAKS